MPGGFVPSEDEGYFFVNVQLPNAASLRRTQEVMDMATAQVEQLPGVQNIITIGGYSLLDQVQGPNYGAAIVSLVPCFAAASPSPAMVSCFAAAFLSPATVSCFTAASL